MLLSCAKILNSLYGLSFLALVMALGSVKPAHPACSGVCSSHLDSAPGFVPDFNCDAFCSGSSTMPLNVVTPAGSSTL